MRRRLWVVLGVAVILAIVAGAYQFGRKSGQTLGRRLIDNVQVIRNAHVGQTKAAIRSIYGAPTRDRKGYRPLGPHVPELPPGPIRTLIFHPLGGTVWVWLEQRGEEWIC